MIFFNKIILRLVRMNSLFILYFSAAFIGLSSFAIYWIEPMTFGNPFNGFWWVMTTVTTVGYGDYYPVTVFGKCLAIFLYIFGIGLISVVISKVVDTIFIYHRKKEEGKLDYHDEQHFVVIEWNKNANLAIEEILKSDPKVEVVLISNLAKTPMVHPRIHYVQGNPASKATLDQANIKQSRAVFIFSNEMTENDHFIRDTSFIDGKTLLVATSIERNYNHVYTIVEVKDRQNIDNFAHIQIDEFILGSETISQLAVRSAFNPGASKIVSQLLTSQHGEDLFEIQKRTHWITFRDAFEELLKDGATLISDGEHLDINRRLDDEITPKARLFVICNKETYLKLTS